MLVELHRDFTGIGRNAFQLSTKPRLVERRSALLSDALTASEAIADLREVFIHFPKAH